MFILLASEIDRAAANWNLRTYTSACPNRRTIITLKNRKPSPVVQRFIDCARDVAKPLAKKKV